MSDRDAYRPAIWIWERIRQLQGLADGIDELLMEIDAPTPERQVEILRRLDAVQRDTANRVIRVPTYTEIRSYNVTWFMDDEDKTRLMRALDHALLTYDLAVRSLQSARTRARRWLARKIAASRVLAPIDLNADDVGLDADDVDFITDEEDE
ncbi:hypothetical protein EDC01DRAFT_781559 [Geopyxis carbonaria]|nr:hypothetical protein EDC01DRAFT_781559 [Geopyxis carbonaria]